MVIQFVISLSVLGLSLKWIEKYRNHGICALNGGHGQFKFTGNAYPRLCGNVNNHFRGVKVEGLYFHIYVC